MRDCNSRAGLAAHLCDATRLPGQRHGASCDMIPKGCGTPRFVCDEPGTSRAQRKPMARVAGRYEIARKRFQKPVAFFFRRRVRALSFRLVRPPPGPEARWRCVSPPSRRAFRAVGGKCCVGDVAAPRDRRAPAFIAFDATMFRCPSSRFRRDAHRAAAARWGEVLRGSDAAAPRHLQRIAQTFRRIRDVDAEFKVGVRMSE